VAYTAADYRNAYLNRATGSNYPTPLISTRNANSYMVKGGGSALPPDTQLPHAEATQLKDYVASEGGTSKRATLSDWVSGIGHIVGAIFAPVATVVSGAGGAIGGSAGGPQGAQIGAGAAALAYAGASALAGDAALTTQDYVSLATKAASFGRSVAAGSPSALPSDYFPTGTPARQIEGGLLAVSDQLALQGQVDRNQLSGLMPDVISIDPSAQPAASPLSPALILAGLALLLLL
jgi:hypothetical protein